MDRLVSTLIEGKHPVEFESRTEDLNELRERIKRGFVFIKFTETQGGTEIGINIDEASNKLDDATLKEETNMIKIVGTCELNYHKVRCHAEINLKTKQGLGYLEVIEDTGNQISSILH